MTERSILRRIRGMDTSDGAGVRLKRIIGQPGLDMVDPFLLLDEFRSDQAGDYIAGFPEHPHRGFETVTYMLAGHMQHGDNHGNRGDLGPGSVQWMTAGRGILHSEMPQQENGLMWGFQLWVNLPATDKMTAPRYQDIAPDRIPVVHPSDGVEVRVIAGERLGRSELAVLSKGDSVRIAGRDAAARVLLVAGKALQEPVARYGPFVMNTPEQIHEAIADFRAGKF